GTTCQRLRLACRSTAHSNLTARWFHRFFREVSWPPRLMRAQSESSERRTPRYAHGVLSTATRSRACAGRSTAIPIRTQATLPSMCSGRSLPRSDHLVVDRRVGENGDAVTDRRRRRQTEALGVVAAGEQPLA